MTTPNIALPTTPLWTPRILSVFRIVIGLLFLSHGVVKLWGFPAGVQPGQVPLIGLYGLAGVLEFFGGGAVMLGLFTRPVAFILSGEMAVAYCMAHLPQSVFPLVNMGEDAILFCFGFLYLAFAGGGAWSVDAARKA
jgi:putative oxidoreductase